MTFIDSAFLAKPLGRQAELRAYSTVISALPKEVI